MQFSPWKEDVASSTYFQLKHDDHMGQGNSCVDLFFSSFPSDLKGLQPILKYNNWVSAWICDNYCWQGGQVFICVCFMHMRCQPSDSLLCYTSSLLTGCIIEKLLTLYSVHILIKLTACWGQLVLPRSTRLRVCSHAQSSVRLHCNMLTLTMLAWWYLAENVEHGSSSYCRLQVFGLKPSYWSIKEQHPAITHINSMLYNVILM